MSKNRFIVSILAAVMLICGAITYSPGEAVVKAAAYQQDQDSSRLLFVYRFRSFAWGYMDNAYLIGADGNVKYVDIAKDKIDAFEEEDSLALLDGYMKDDSIPVIKKVSVSLLLDKMATTMSEVKLEENSNIMFDAGNRSYYCVSSLGDSRKLILLQQIGEQPLASKSVKARYMCKFIDKVIQEK